MEIGLLALAFAGIFAIISIIGYIFQQGQPKRKEEADYRQIYSALYPKEL